MTYDEVLSYFGTQIKIAEALGITQATVSLWGANGEPKMVPAKYQYQLEVITRGELMADRRLRKYAVPQAAA